MTTELTPEAEAISRIQESIKNADLPEVAPASEPTPTEAKPTETQVAETGKDGNAKVNEVVEPAKAEIPPTETKVEDGKTAVQESPKEVAENPFNLPEEELHDLLGLPKAEIDTVETLKTKYANSSREAHRLVELEKGRQEFFKSQGLIVHQTEDGKFVLIPDEKYESKLDVSKDLNLKKLVDNLSEQDRDELVTEPEKVLTKLGTKIAMEILAKRPPVSNQRVEIQLTREQSNKVWDDFQNAKLQDGKTARYQDANNPAVVSMMEKMLSVESPAMDKFKKMMNSDPDLHHVGFEYLYLKTRNAMLEGKLRQTLMSNQKATQKKELETKTAINAGTSIPTAGQVQTSTLDARARMEQLIREA